MTKEEFEQLQPGDLITHLSCEEPVLVVLKICEENVWFFRPTKNKIDYSFTPEYCSIVWKKT